MFSFAVYSTQMRSNHFKTAMWGYYLRIWRVMYILGYDQGGSNIVAALKSRTGCTKNSFSFELNGKTCTFQFTGEV